MKDSDGPDECRKPTGERDLEARLEQAEATVLELQQQLQQAQKMETLGTLVAGVAHEINNPINLMMYNLPLIKQVWEDFQPLLRSAQKSEPDRKYGGFTYDFLMENMSQLIGDMELAAGRVTKIVADLKDFSRRSSAAEKVSMSLNRAVKNALRLAQTTLRASGVQLELDLSDNLPEFEGIQQSIEQIVLNIVINAVQAIDHDRGRICIETGYQLKDGRIFVHISDNGRGISSQIAGKIFLPFVTDKLASGGTGLGLSVSYNLVKAHDGEIKFESREGEGTHFWVYFPTRAQRRLAKVLVVDDDRMVRRLLIEALSMTRKYLIEEASNGIEASIKLGTYRPDLLILDIFMPEMDGLEVCRNIKAEPELADMKVVITTGYPSHPKLDEVAGLGYTDVFFKPFDLRTLTAHIHEQLYGK
jgi:signal transduction histidine kinase/CheY-like chemotaxis protein